MAIVREYQPVLKALEAVYRVKERPDLQGKPDRIADEMRNEMIRRFGPLESKHGPLLIFARNLTGHLPTRPPQKQVMSDLELPLHGFSDHSQVDETYHIHLHEGLADIAAAVALSRIREKMAGRKGKGKKGKLTDRMRRTGEHDFEGILSQVRWMGERREGASRFDLLVAIARHAINQFVTGSGGPITINGVPSATSKHYLETTGYSSALQEVRRLKTEGLPPLRPKRR